MNKNSHKKGISKYDLVSGFSLIEALVGLTILSVGLIGILALVSGSISNTLNARDKTVAIYLASEAIEIIKNKRDSNLLAEVQWDDGFGTECNGVSCIADSNATLGVPIISPCVGACTFDIYEVDYNSNKMYGHRDVWDLVPGATITLTNFTREITSGPTIPSSGNRLITAVVSWRTSGGDTQQVVVKEYIFDAGER